MIAKFVRRLGKIGITTEYFGNHPWIYLSKVNGITIKDKYLGNHGFTAFWQTKDGSYIISDRKIVFNLIRK